LLDQLDGDEDLMERMVMLFRESTPRLLEQISAAIASEDAPGLARSAHALFSSLGCGSHGSHEPLAN
jgi:HPt (histidine-containing phosphotransfer) domain-containing protein